MTNVGRSQAWNGFITKPTLYLAHMRKLINDIPPEKLKDSYAILMDSDTMWATNAVATIWDKYDCARGDKDLVISSEMSCWIGT